MTKTGRRPPLLNCGFSCMVVWILAMFYGIFEGAMILNSEVWSPLLMIGGLGVLFGGVFILSELSDG